MFRTQEAAGQPDVGASHPRRASGRVQSRQFHHPLGDESQSSADLLAYVSREGELEREKNRSLSFLGFNGTVLGLFLELRSNPTTEGTDNGL